MCEVRQLCLEFAITEGERFGIWGGLTTQERRSLAAKRRKAQMAARTTARV
jgi:WhiB family redox-sensing transcriptional regulator